MAQAECITTAIRELMSRARLPKSTNPVRLAHTELVAVLAGNVPHPIYAVADSEDLDSRAEGVRGAARLCHRDHCRHGTERPGWYARPPLPRQPDPGFVGRRGGCNPQCCRRNARARELEGVMTLPFEAAQTSPKRSNRRGFLGGSDAQVIMGSDEAALLQLWREKRGEVEPEDLSDNLIVQLGLVTESLNRHWFERNTGQIITDVQRRVQHPVIRWMAATLDGMVEQSGAVFEAKFMLPWSFSEVAAAEKYMPQLHHNMWVVNAKAAVLSIITGGGKWVEITIPADPLYQHLLLTAEKKFWRCVESGEPPRLFGIEPPRPRIEAVRMVDMSASNAWAEFSGVFLRTREAHLEHENAKAELKSLMPEDAKEVTGHGIRAKRSNSGAVRFEPLSMEGGRAPL
jgi:hypothetical protein